MWELVKEAAPVFAAISGVATPLIVFIVGRRAKKWRGIEETLGSIRSSVDHLHDCVENTKAEVKTVGILLRSFEDRQANIEKVLMDRALR